jgi:hypothetical protein
MCEDRCCPHIKLGEPWIVPYQLRSLAVRIKILARLADNSFGR